MHYERSEMRLEHVADAFLEPDRISYRDAPTLVPTLLLNPTAYGGTDGILYAQTHR